MILIVPCCCPCLLVVVTSLPDFRMGRGSFLPEVTRFGSDFRRVMPSGDDGMLFEHGHGLRH